MKKLLLVCLFIIPIFSIVSCSSDDNGQSDTSENSIVLPISGEYHWSFSIPGMGEQTSSMTFSNKEIDYKMTGKVYNNQYKMIIESYDKKNMKIIAIGKGGEGNYKKDGHYFVIFLKDIDKNSVLIYKKDDCNNKEDAEKAEVPLKDNTQNHGWNLYTKK